MEKYKMIKGGYGKELILDIHEADAKLFTRIKLRKFFTVLCLELQMVKCDLHFWDDVGVPKKDRQTEPHLKGTSAVQFIMTSNITIHTLDLMKRVYLNIFSCKDFDEKKAEKLCIDWFGGKVVNSKCFKRK